MEISEKTTEVEEIKLDEHIEFETKYRVDGNLVYEFKKLVETISEPSKFTYVQGPDFYFTKPDDSFLRYRKADNEKRAEVTMKEKPTGARHNIKRKEVNWRVDGTKYETIYEGAMMQGYKYNFKIRKMCHIYNFKDVTLVFYTVEDDSGKLNHFIEIELDEESIHTLTEDQAWDRIRKYETILSPLGITHRNRLTKSLFEMYKKDIHENRNSEIQPNAIV